MTLHVKSKTVIAIVTALLISNLSFSQKITRRYIDSLLNISSADNGNKAQILFIINGIPYETYQVDTVISKYDLRYLADAILISKEKISSRSDMAVIVFACRQKNKIKRKRWKEAKKIFNESNETSSQLLIDKALVEPQQSKKTFNSLRLKDIMYIDTTQKGNIKQVRIWKVD